MNTAAAFANAKHRLSHGWPLALILIALYGPITGTAQLALLATGLFFLSRGAPPPTGHRPSSALAKPSGTRPRDPDGKWTR